ncbi:hypothetical protein ZIOFF_021956 [Zingiber officinale]|uniref:Uncharacterized protein n=1 Tax=Zingiber officinale TaxID=94328 RepID=A0A8J5HKQ5_ZINOF|nr:hypothetical protein ZIOFF_021956 [Zingiber officinale]
MDELTSSLDARTAAIVMRAVKNVSEPGRTILKHSIRESKDMATCLSTPSRDLKELTFPTCYPQNSWERYSGSKESNYFVVPRPASQTFTIQFNSKAFRH